MTDSGANIKKAIIDTFGEKRQMACLAHTTINLIVKKSISKTQEESPVTKILVRSIVKYFKKSTKLCDEL